MHGFHCRGAVQPGCNLSPAPTLLPGRMAPTCAAAPQHRPGVILRGPPTEAKASGWELRALTPRLCFHVHKRVNPHKWGISSQMGRLGPLFVITGGNPVRNASHKLEYGVSKNPCFLSFLILKTCSFCVCILHDFSRYLWSSKENPFRSYYVMKNEITIVLCLFYEYR